MSIFVVGMNHKTAPVHLREQVYFAFDKLSLYLQDLLGREAAREVLLLSTCNRSELYCETDDVTLIRDWFCSQVPLPASEMAHTVYVLQGEAAVEHIIHVACGLDSMVLGEPQILGQMKEAFSESCAAGAVGGVFHQLFQHVFSIAKEIRTTTAIGACPVSVASAAARFAKQLTDTFEQARVVLVGAGDTTELLARYLKNSLAAPLTLVNRNTENAAVIAQAVGGQALSLDKLALALAEADIVFSATGSLAPIISRAAVEKAMQARKDRTMILIDIAVPRDIEPAVADIENVRLFCIDDLKVIIEKNLQGREHAADKARELIRKKSADFMMSLKSSDKVANTIRAYRGQIEEICRAELLKAKLQLSQGDDPEQVLEMFAHAFIRKLLHAPSVQLRQAGVEGRFELLRYAKQLFAIPDPEAERI
ncbi:Glutamyl-tRNA reductase [Aquicella siphonis]|uniref:Glutamyl-tRNA reductase n=1 Tax=Aquicella siphonis TaxID=254247 RepID=A0A5E4PJF0_9COXI|nr:glutamyl-tRNA reductase [Aquicella siphonis]VVC76695.1 Glutamyl-tRNA reductase [Aquicella siphonis]